MVNREIATKKFDAGLLEPGIENLVASPLTRKKEVENSSVPASLPREPAIPDTVRSAASWRSGAA